MKKTTLSCFFCGLSLMGLPQNEERFKGLNKKELQEMLLRVEQSYLQKLEEKDSILKEHKQTILEIKESSREIQDRLDQTESTVEARNELIDTQREQIDFLHGHIDFLHEHLKEVRIGNQVWMTQNLNVDKFRNGDPIPEVKSNWAWQEAGRQGQPAWCYFDNDPTNGDKYGKLYNWHAVNDPRGLAPEGWHIPNDAEWETLFSYVGEAPVEKMKRIRGWDEDRGKSLQGRPSNESGFSGMPGGWRVNVFDEGGTWATWWCGSPGRFESAGNVVYFDSYDKDPIWDWFGNAVGLSVRCLKD